MKLSILFLISFLSIFQSNLCLAQFTEEFEDTDLSTSPTWQGDLSNFTVENGQLKSQCNIAKSFYIATQSNLQNQCEWEILVNLDFLPSSKDYMDIHLLSDLPQPSFSGNGAILRIGGKDKSISLIIKQYNFENLLIESPHNIFESHDNIFRIKVTLDDDKNWGLLYDQDDIGQYTDEGQIYFNINFAIPYFSINIIQSDKTSVINHHHIEEIYLRKTIKDTTPPKLLKTIFTNEHTLKLTFDKVMTLQKNEYFKLNGVAPTQKELYSNDNRVILLRFDDAFEDKKTYNLEIGNLEDNHQNVMPTNTVQIVYYKSTKIAYKDIIINEMMIDPIPQIGLPNAEYIELYNRSEKYLDLRLSSINKVILTEESYTLAPHQYLTICPNSKLKYFDKKKTIGLKDFPTLNNTNGEISLLDRDLSDIDKVIYDKSWYKDYEKDNGGYSLELINPQEECSGAHNWKASKDKSGGTPSLPNSILDASSLDTIPFNVSNWQVLDQQQLYIKLNKYIAQKTLLNANFSIDQGVSILKKEIIAGDEVLLYFDQILSKDKIYTLSIDGLVDCAGHPLADNQLPFGLGIKPQRHQLLITEIMSDPDPTIGLPPLEYLEIYNASDHILELRNCQLSDNKKTYNFPAHSIMPHKYLILCSKNYKAAFEPFGEVLALKSFVNLTNSGKPLTLYDDNQQVLHTLYYSNEWHDLKSDGGVSLEILDTDHPCIEQKNWKSSKAKKGGTPGQQNSTLQPIVDNMPPSLRTINAINDTTIILEWTEKLDSTAIINATYTFSPSFQIKKIKPIAPRYQKTIIYTEPLDKKQVYQIHISKIWDCSGNEIEGIERRFGVPQKASKNDIILNEILFNPRKGGKDFIELYNQSDKYINLNNWKIGNKKEGEFGDTVSIKEHLVLSPKSYVAITTDTSIVQSHYPKAFGKPFYQIKSLPSYPDDAGTFLLYDPQDTIMQKFDYEDDMHLDLLDDLDGISLERTDFDTQIQEVNAWISAAYTHNHATPAYENSQHSLSKTKTIDISISPKVIAPFSNGINDYMLITYHNKYQGMLAGIYVFDKHGRKIKTIIQNQYLGDSDSYRWDGDNDEKAEVPFGPYIIFIELFERGGQKKVFKEMVVVSGE